MIASLLNHGNGDRALRAGDSGGRRLWSGCASLWAPCASGRFPLGSSYSTRDQAISDLGFLRQGLRKSGGGTVGANPFGYGLALSGAGGGFLVASGSLGNFNFIHQSAVYSFAALVRSDAVSTNSVIVYSCLGSSVNTGFQVRQNSSGIIDALVARSGGFVVFGSSASALVAGAWTMIVVASDGAFQRIWLNGRRSGADTAIGTLGGSDASYAMGIGCYGGGVNTNVWNGQLAWFGIWKRALGGSDARALTADPLCMFRRRRQSLGRGPGFRPWFVHRSTLLGGIA